MRKKRLRFCENYANPLFVEQGKPFFDSVKGKWGPVFFGNTAPIVLELGCGTGVYTMYLAERCPEKNFVGVDIKGSRMWVGAQKAYDMGLTNVGFLRARVETLENFFVPRDVDEIYVTFPDPRPKDRDAKKRLTSPRFLTIYKNIMRLGGCVHLKTDNGLLYDYTLEVIKKQGYRVVIATDDLYATHADSMHTQIQTVYEQRFLAGGHKIKYVCFVL